MSHANRQPCCGLGLYTLCCFYPLSGHFYHLPPVSLLTPYLRDVQQDPRTQIFCVVNWNAECERPPRINSPFDIFKGELGIAAFEERIEPFRQYGPHLVIPDPRRYREA